MNGIYINEPIACVFRNCIVWSGERTPEEKARLRAEIEAMDAEGQEYWRVQMAWVFE